MVTLCTCASHSLGQGGEEESESTKQTYQVDPELAAVAVDLVCLRVADGGEVDGPRGVEAVGVDHQLQGLQRQRGVLPLRAERRISMRDSDTLLSFCMLVNGSRMRFWGELKVDNANNSHSFMSFPCLGVFII